MQQLIPYTHTVGAVGDMHGAWQSAIAYVSSIAIHKYKQVTNLNNMRGAIGINAIRVKPNMTINQPVNALIQIFASS